jgi:hypothetical protein
MDVRDLIAGVAVALALAGVTLGIIAVTDDNVKEKTLRLKTAREGEKPLSVGAQPAFTFSSPFTGDRKGIQVGHCLPDGSNAIGCDVTYILRDGKIAVQNGRLLNSRQLESPIVGGTGAYEGATGTLEGSGPDDSTLVLHLRLPD